jgi:hypothetical protein
MATDANTVAAANTPAPAAKEKTVIDDMDGRRIFPNPEETTAYIANAMTTYSDFGNYPVAAPGVSVNEETGALEFDPEVYTPDTRVMVAVLTQRGEGPQASSTVKAIVIAPIPTLDAILGNPEGNAWAQRILEKELNHVAVRQLRKAESIGDVVDTMPKTLSDYITSNREGGGMLQAYEDLWRSIKNSMGKLSRSWKLANLSKKELRRGLESAAYAGEYYPTLEETKQGSLFVFALHGLTAQAKKQGLDPAIFERWLANRDEKKIDVDAEDEEEFTLDDLTAALDQPEPAATPATEGEAPAPAPAPTA